MKHHYFDFSDGRKLSWYEAGSGPTLVLLHGWSISAAAFREITGKLQSEFHVLIPDLPGHGESSPSPVNTLTSLSDDLVTWLKAVNNGSAVLAGWSLGGMLAMHIASMSLLPIQSLILIGTTPRFTITEGWQYGLPVTQVNALARNLRRRFEATLSEFFQLTFAGEVIQAKRLREILGFAVRNNPLPDKDVAAGLLGVLTCQDQRDYLPEISCPVLVMHGEEDQVSPVSAGRYVSEKVSNGTLVLLKGVGHAPFWSQPDLFVNHVREFVHGAN